LYPKLQLLFLMNRYQKLQLYQVFGWFSIVEVEAMAYGCSIIATKNVGVHSALITHCKNGYGFEVEISTELERAIEKSIIHKILLLGTRARDEVLENWSAKKETNNSTTIYKS